MSLSAIINDSNQPFILLQSSCAQSCIPILRQLVVQSHKSPTVQRLLFSFLVAPTDLLEEGKHLPENLEVHDFTAAIPGYSDLVVDPLKVISSAIAKSSGPLQVIIDSVDVVLEDDGTISRAYTGLLEISKTIRKRGGSLIIHTFQPSQLVPLLLQPSFSPSVTYLITHPPALIRHLAKEYLVLPPPVSDTPKFWNAFLPLAERIHDVEYLVYGSDGEGSGAPHEIVVEFLLRTRDGTARRRNIERGFEGWNVPEAKPCPLTKLDILKGIWKTNPQNEEVSPESSHQASFNLQLTDAQKESRAQVPLPYAHEGKGTAAVPAIYYDPDSADDMDDDDPDEDLNI